MSDEDDIAISVIGEVAADSIRALQRIHGLACEGGPDALDRIREEAKTATLDAAGRMGEIDAA